MNGLLNQVGIFPHRAEQKRPDIKILVKRMIQQMTDRMPTQGEDYYVLTLNGKQIRVPAFLFSPAYRKVFNSFISKVYRLAMARARQEETTDLISTDTLVDAVKRERGIEIGTQKKTELSTTAMQMVLQLETLQRQGRNGIWHFIISNSYRPGLTEARCFRMIASGLFFVSLLSISSHV